MSRSMTAAQVISQGDYLNPDFDPNSLTVSQLLGIFGFHNIRYPTPYTKPKLVQLFLDEIKPQTKKFKKEKLKAESSTASDEGVKDGITGELLNPPKPLRRSSRQSSRAPTAEPEPIKSEPTKRRRGSAQPPNRTSRVASAAQVEPVLEEESEPEEEAPVRKVGRNVKDAEGAGTRARQVSQTFAEDSGWEDNNVFQSGAESSSPARPPPKPRTRKQPSKAAPTRRSTRKASVQPAENQPSSSSRASAEGEESEEHAPPARVSPPRSAKFEPRLSPEAVRENAMFTSPVKSPLKASNAQSALSGSLFQHLSPFRPTKSPIKPTEDIVPDSDPDREHLQESEDGESEEDEVEAAEAHLSSSSIITKVSNDEIVDYGLTPEPRVGIFPRVLVVLTVLLAGLVTWPYKTQSVAVGFCDAGSSTNEVLESLRTHTAAIEACQRENRTTLYLPPVKGVDNTEGMEACPTVLESILPVPDSCTPCPAHAVCSRHEVVCNKGFIIRPHPVLSFLPFRSIQSLNVTSAPSTLPEFTQIVLNTVSAVLDGLPRLGPVALPPRCVEDPRRKRHIGALGKAIEVILGMERGRRLCSGDVKPLKDEEGGEARAFGMEISSLRDSMRKKTAPQLLETFDDTFNEAIKQLQDWGGVVTSLDKEGHKYIAHNTATLDLACTVRVKSREAWIEWRASVLSAVALVLSAVYWNMRRASRKVERARIRELVLIVLDSLRNQELAYYTDPVSTPQPFLSSLQLRDQVLQDVHSISRRTRIWNQVARIVESNTNVRVNEQEVAGGDELRVWLWVGNASRPRVTYEGEEGRIVA